MDTKCSRASALPGKVSIGMFAFCQVAYSKIRLLDFYELHLKFKTSEDDAPEAANGKANGDAMEED